MYGLNKVFIMGRLGSDPASYNDKAGRAYAKMSLATQRGWKNSEGAFEQKTEWHKIFVWGRQAENCLRYLKKGAPVLVEGFISHFDSNVDGQKRTHLSITAERVEFLPNRSKGQTTAASQSPDRDRGDEETTEEEESSDFNSPWTSDQPGQN